MTLAMFPAYVLARTVASPRGLLVAAVGTAAVPALVYSPMILEEPLSYPYATLCFLTIACALTNAAGRIAAPVVLSLVGGFIRGELGVLPIVFVLAAGLYVLSGEPHAVAIAVHRLGLGRRRRARRRAGDPLQRARRQVLRRAGRSRPASTGPDDRLRAAVDRLADDRARAAAGGRRARDARALEGRGAHARAARLHEPVRVGRGRLRRLHGGQGRVPLDGRRSRGSRSGT